MDYQSKLGDIRQPFLLVAGEKDKLALRSSIEEGYRSLGNHPDNKLTVVENSGHLDLAVGKSAPFTMFEIFRFFSRFC